MGVPYLPSPRAAGPPNFNSESLASCSGANATAVWLLAPVPGGTTSVTSSVQAAFGAATYYVVNQYNFACLDAPSVAQAQANACGTTATQIWTLVSSSYSGYYQLQNVGLSGTNTGAGSALCLDLSYGNLSANTTIDVWYCASSGVNQLFAVPAAGTWGTLGMSGSTLGTASGYCVDNGARAPSPATVAAVVPTALPLPRRARCSR